MDLGIFKTGVGCVAAALALWLAGSQAAAQNPPLGEVARKEQERRKTVKKASDKVLTNKDLPPAAARPAPTAPAPGTGAPADTTGQENKPPATTAKDEEKEEAWWRQRITQAREGLRRSEVFLEALQTRVNVLSADFVNRDDPVQRARIGEDRQKALAEMERVQAEIASFKKQIEDIEEEARKAGIPPGWLR
jgi:hypothetical protein